MGDAASQCADAFHPLRPHELGILNLHIYHNNSTDYNERKQVAFGTFPRGTSLFPCLYLGRITTEVSLSGSRRSETRGFEGFRLNTPFEFTSNLRQCTQKRGAPPSR